jgi:hypothetical protein
MCGKPGLIASHANVRPSTPHCLCLLCWPATPSCCSMLTGVQACPRRQNNLSKPEVSYPTAAGIGILGALCLAKARLRRCWPLLFPAAAVSVQTFKFSGLDAGMAGLSGIAAVSLPARMEGLPACRALRTPTSSWSEPCAKQPNRDNRDGPQAQSSQGQQHSVAKREQQ